MFVFLLDLLKFVLTNNVFEIDGHFFTQKFGIAMGTKLAPALATVVVADFERKSLRKTSKKALLWQHYIDDVLTFWPHTEPEFLNFVHGLNSLAPRLLYPLCLPLFHCVFRPPYL